MAKFSDKSKRILLQCHADIQAVLNYAIRFIDFSVECGTRGRAAQNAAYNRGASKVMYPNSKHNRVPSDAVDVKPWFPDREAAVLDYIFLCGFIMACAKMLLVRGRIKSQFRYGGDWDSDACISEEKFLDSGHLERKAAT